MKRFLPISISILLHAVVLLLLCSWEIPLADRLLPRSIVEVSLIEQIEGKPEGKKEGGIEKAGPPPIKQRKMQQKKKAEATRHASGVIARPEKDLKIDEPKPVKVEPVPKEIREEKAKTEGEIPAGPPVLTALSEEFPVLMARVTPPAGDMAEMRESPIPMKASPGSLFLSSAGPESGQGRNCRWGRRKRFGGRAGEGGTSRSAVFKGRQVMEVRSLPRSCAGSKRPSVTPGWPGRWESEGQATVRFKLKGNGGIEKAELLETSGSEILDQASLETIQRAAPLPYKEGWLKVVIVFKIL